MSSAWPSHAYPPPPRVGTHTSYPPLPPKPVKRRNMAQSLLLALVILALCGMVVGACLIYDLYQRQTLVSYTTSLILSYEELFLILSYEAGKKKPGKDGVMLWEAVEEPDRLDEIIMQGMKYENGRIIIPKEGYYSLYSKLYLKDPNSHMILHTIVKTTTRYPKEIVLLRSKRFRRKGDTSDTTNSYLEGVFHLIKDDAIFVKVNNHTEIILEKPADNYFGVYML
ncbi:hypothetical protein ACEWY4_003363 [Coilia grayii]|uniref:THD domain-containing protein n=1 Tax=Coilia grayii TaxID=363190 RepID=A0ABD1KR07_9TELE